MTDEDIEDIKRRAAEEARAETLNALKLWVDSRLDDEVAHRPPQNVIYNALKGTWEQVQRKLEEMGSQRPPR